MGLGIAQGCSMRLPSFETGQAVFTDGLLRSDANVVESRPHIGGDRMAATHGASPQSFSTIRVKQEVLERRPPKSSKVKYRISFRKSIEQRNQFCIFVVRVRVVHFFNC